MSVPAGPSHRQRPRERTAATWSVALPQGTLARPQAFHHLIYNAFLGGQDNRAFLFQGHCSGGRTGGRPGRAALPERTPNWRGRSVYDPAVDAYDFHLTASPQYRDTASGKLKLFPAEDDNAQRLTWAGAQSRNLRLCPNRRYRLHAPAETRAAKGQAGHRPLRIQRTPDRYRPHAL